MPRGVYIRRPRSEVVSERISGVRREAVRHRWESVKKEQEEWLKPFHELEVEVALRYLEDIRIICEKAGTILNARINDNKNIKCSGPRCGKDLTGTRPNGMPKWIAKMDFKDKSNPNIFHCLYYCSELCRNEYTRAHMLSAVSDGK
jgi:hypothetical protein